MRQESVREVGTFIFSVVKFLQEVMYQKYIKKSVDFFLQSYSKNKKSVMGRVLIHVVQRFAIFEVKVFC